MMRDAAVIREVGLRDGLQMVRDDLSTARKLEWIADAAAAGVRQMEVTSFVPPKTFPIFSDAATVAAAALQLPEIAASALVVNLRGAKDAFQSGLRCVNYVLSASEKHSQANARRSTDDALQEFRRIVALRDQLGLRDAVHLNCGIATSFGCSLQGEVPESRVLELAVALAQAGAQAIMLADTVGHGAPSQVERLFTGLRAELPDVEHWAHFHDTRGLGLANVAAAAHVGIRHFDAALGGLGGCPYAPGASGNVNLEDTAYLLEAEGFDTGLNIERLVQLRRKIEGWLPSETFAGAIARAGVTSVPKPPDIETRGRRYHQAGIR